jgi:hypothetical protein
VAEGVGSAAVTAIGGTWKSRDLSIVSERLNFDTHAPRDLHHVIFRRPIVALAVFAALAILHTWPLAANPAHLSRNDNADTELNTWAIAWVAHQLPRDPVHLFDANIFYPERHTLGYSEAMIVQGVLAMPVIAAGGSPVLAYNLVLLAGFTLTGWAFWLLARQWTGCTGAAYVCGALAAFNSHVLVRLPHLQTQHVEFIALVLFALDRVLVSARARDAGWLAVGYALQGLTSVYVLVFTTWLLIFASASRARAWLGRGRRRTAGMLALAGGAAAVLLAPYVAAYLEVNRLQGFERSVDDARAFAGSWRDYLATGSRLYYEWWSRPFVDQAKSDLFPGITALLLAIAAFAWPENRASARFRMCVGAAAGCAAVAFAPYLPFFPVLYRVVPLFHAVRVEAHIGQIVLLLVAVVAAFGMAGLLRRIPSRGARLALTAAALVLVTAEALRAPLDYTPFGVIPHVYDRLASEPDAVVAELPMWPPRSFFGNAAYMLASTRHWRPMLNGYSGFRPPSYDAVFAHLSGFPDLESLAALRGRGVTDVIVHRAMLEPDRAASLDRIGSLQLLAEEGDIAIYRLR